MRFYLGVLMLLGVIGSGASTLIMSRIVTGAFDKARGTALGLGLAGIGITSMIAPSALAQVAADHGWRGAYLALVALLVVATPLVAIPVWRSERRRGWFAGPIDDPRRRRGSGDILSQPIFWKLALAFFLVQVSITGLLVHFIPLLGDRGMAAREAAALCRHHRRRDDRLAARGRLHHRPRVRAPCRAGRDRSVGGGCRAAGARRRQAPRRSARSRSGW